MPTTKRTPRAYALNPVNSAIWTKYLEYSTAVLRETVVPQKDYIPQLAEQFELRRSSIDRLIGMAQQSTESYVSKIIHSPAKGHSIRKLVGEINKYGEEIDSKIQFFPATASKSNCLASMSKVLPAHITINVGVCPGPMRVDSDGVLAYFLAAIEVASFFKDLRKNRTNNSTPLYKALFKCNDNEAVEFIRLLSGEVDESKVQVTFKIASHLSTIKVDESHLGELYEKCSHLRILANAAVVYATKIGVTAHVEEDNGIIQSTTQLCDKLDLTLLQKAFYDSDPIENVLMCLAILKITQFSLDTANSSDRTLETSLPYIYALGHVELFDKLREKGSSHVQIQWGGRHEFLYSLLRERLMHAINLSPEEKKILFNTADPLNCNTGLIGLNWNIIAYNLRDPPETFKPRLQKILSSSELQKIDEMKIIADSDLVKGTHNGSDEFDRFSLARSSWISNLTSSTVSKNLIDVHEFMGHMIGETSLLIKSRK